MAFLQSLFNRFLPKTANTEQEAADHYTALEKLRSNHEWIDVKLAKTDESYQSLILNIDIENNELLIDELYPPENIAAIEAGDTVVVRSQSKRYPVSFFSRILAREFSNGEGSWRLELPDDVGRNQSRSAFRIYVETEPGLEIELYRDGEPLPGVKIINLSAEGLKLNFAEESGPLINQDPVFKHCLIRLPNDIDIDCDIEIRNTYTIRTPSPHILGGGKLIIDNPQQRVKLQQYLAAIQRRQRRRETRNI